MCTVCYLESVTDFRQLAILMDNEKGVLMLKCSECHVEHYVFWWLLWVYFLCVFNLAMKEMHREIARGKQRRKEFKYVTQKGRI